MQEITLQPLSSIQYQPNIVIAILLGIYTGHDCRFIINKGELGSSEPNFNKFIDTLIDSVKIKNLYPLIDKIEDRNAITLKVDGFRFDPKVQREVEYKHYYREMLKDYVEKFHSDSLTDSLVNLPSWKTLYNNFLNSIDRSCILKDYKMNGLEFIQLIAYFVVNHDIGVRWIKILPKFNENDDILADSSWEVTMSLSLYSFIHNIEERKAKKEESKAKKLIKYTAKEVKFINYVEENIGYESLRIEPEEVLEVLNPDGHAEGIPCKNPKKYVSNFISRLNKKYLYNTGRKLIECKEFRNCYVALNNF